MIWKELIILRLYVKLDQILFHYKRDFIIFYCKYLNDVLFVGFWVVHYPYFLTKPIFYFYSLIFYNFQLIFSFINAFSFLIFLKCCLSLSSFFIYLITNHYGSNFINFNCLIQSISISYSNQINFILLLLCSILSNILLYQMLVMNLYLVCLIILRSSFINIFTLCVFL